MQLAIRFRAFYPTGIKGAKCITSGCYGWTPPPTKKKKKELLSHVSSTFHTTPRPRYMLSLIRRWWPVAGERLEHATEAVKGARYPTMFGKKSYYAFFLN